MTLPAVPPSTKRLFWLVMATTTAVRVYYLFVTAHQPVWWDEAEYLVKAKALALGTPATGFWAGRPPLMPLLLSGVFAVGLGELTIRVLLVAASQASVYLTFRIGQALFGDLAGLFGAWLFGLFYLNVFFTMRVMTEIPQLVLVLLAFQQLLDAGRFSAATAALALSLAVFVRYPSGLMFVVMGAHIVRTEGLSALRNRQNALAMGVALVVAFPFLLNSYKTWGDPFGALKASAYLMPAMDITTRLSGLAWYGNWARAALGLPLSTVAGAGVLVSVISVTLGRRLARLADTRSADLLVLLWIAVPVVYFGLFVRPGQDRDRYVLLALPPLFLATGRLLAWLAEGLAKLTRAPVGVAVVAAMVVSAGPLLATTDRNIRGRRQSFAPLRDAAVWLTPRLSTHSVVLSKSVAQLTYYTSHAIIDLPETPAEFDALRAAGRVDFVVITQYEAHPAWIATPSFEVNGLREVAVFPDIGAPVVYVLTGAPSR
jgi:hypothetical protein